MDVPPPPTLDYATPDPWRVRVRAWLEFNEAWFCAFAIVPTATMAVAHWRSSPPVDGPIAIVAVAITIAFWPALLVERIVLGRPSPMAMMRPSSAAFVLLMLVGFRALLHGGVDDRRWFLFTWVHVTTFAWLAGSALKRRGLSRVTIAGLTLAMVVSAGQVQHCPHSKTFALFGVPLHREGRPCKNPQQWHPWWNHPGL